jgi:hypothetical protein
VEFTIIVVAFQQNCETRQEYYLARLISKGVTFTQIFLGAARTIGTGSHEN